MVLRFFHYLHMAQPVPLLISHYIYNVIYVQFFCNIVIRSLVISDNPQQPVYFKTLSVSQQI
jgi:hypothetical protein